MNFSIAKKGYNIQEVEDYIEELEKQLDEYKEKSSAINNAIINAQLAADNIINNAKERAGKIVSAAELEAKSIKEKAISQIVSMKSNIAAQKKVIADFENEYTSFLKRYIKPVNSNDIAIMTDKLNNAEKLVEEFSSVMSSKHTDTGSIKTENQPEFLKKDDTLENLKKYNNDSSSNSQKKPILEKEEILKSDSLSDANESSGILTEEELVDLMPSHKKKFFNKN